MRRIRLINPDRDIGLSKFGIQAQTVYRLLQAAAVDGVVTNPLDVQNMIQVMIDLEQLITKQDSRGVFRSSVSKLIESGWVERLP